ncbi:MAG: hypothetical protein KDD47_18450, partial [Acidobacteria bacterium]|nr:hypothetical protein [Acidobacteriota bacterium]
YRGAVVDFSGRTWVPLAPAMKTTSRVASTGILAQMGFAADAFETSFLGSEQVTSPLEQVRRQVQDYLVQEAPGETYAGQLGSRSVVPEGLGLLPSSLPMKVVAVTSESADLPPAEVTRVRVIARTGASAASPAALDVELPLSEMVGRRVTLSYTPAEVEDHRTVNAYGGLYAVPVYLVRLRPQLKIAGRPVDVGDGALDMGVPHRVEVVLEGPWGTETVSQTVLSGSYHALALGAQKVERPDESLEDPGDTESQGAKILGQMAGGYGAAWDASEGELAGLMDVEVLRPLPSLAVASLSLQVEELLGLPFSVVFEGVTLDAGLRVAEPLRHRPTGLPPTDWMRLSALHGSALEHLVFGREYLVESISADRGLGLARDLGVEVLTLDSSNLPSELPTLAHPQVVKDDIANWVRLGLTVEVPRSQVTLNAWTGSVWRALESSTGASGYFIAGSLAGGATSEPPSSWILDFLAQALASAYSSEPNTDPLSVATLSKIPASDGQQGEVGQAFDLPLAVLARDENGRPVVGAEVTFSAVRGDGMLSGDGATGASVVVLTDGMGMARARLTSGEQTSANPWYVRRQASDRFSTQALMNFVEAAAPTLTDLATIRQPFSALAFPGAPAALRRTNDPVLVGTAGTWADSVLVSVEDSFGNPISNEEVTFSVGAATQRCDPADNFQNGAVFNNLLGEDGGFADCGFFSPVLGDCGSSSYTAETSRRGASAGLILGNTILTTYRFNVDAAGVPGLNIEIDAGGSQCNQGPRRGVSTTTIIGQRGQNINAAKAGEVSQFPVLVTLLYSEPDYEVAVDGDGKCYLDYKPTNTWVRTTGNVSYTVSNGGSAGGISLRGDGSYEGFIRTGLTPGVNDVALEATDMRVVVATVNPDSCAEGTDEILFDHSADLPDVFGLNPQVLEIQPAPVLLSDEGVSLSPVLVSYRTDPVEYFSDGIEVDLLENGGFLGFVVGDSLAGAGGAVLARGVEFDIAKTYEAEVVVNRGS